MQPHLVVELEDHFLLSLAAVLQAESVHIATCLGCIAQACNLCIPPPDSFLRAPCLQKRLKAKSNGMQAGHDICHQDFIRRSIRPGYPLNGHQLAAPSMRSNLIAPSRPGKSNSITQVVICLNCIHHAA